MTERTLIIVKPDAFQADKTDAILQAFQNHGFSVLASKQVHLSLREAQDFYAEHRGKPFFADLVAFMTSGPCLAAVVEAENAIERARRLVGATNPSLAAEGTLRRSFGSSTTRNAVHASDSPESAQREIPFFFPTLIAQIPVAQGFSPASPASRLGRPKGLRYKMKHSQKVGGDPLTGPLNKE